MTRTNRKGFTLIEILIVVIILGILAAIVIPQFTNASKEAKQSSLVTQVQSLRSQIALFKLQHNDYLPGMATLGAAGPIADDGTVFWAQMTNFTNLAGATSGTKVTSTGFVYGPYMQSTSKNPLTGGSVIKDGTAYVAGADFVYDYNGGSGKLWGVADGALVQQ